MYAVISNEHYYPYYALPQINVNKFKASANGLGTSIVPLGVANNGEAVALFGCPTAGSDISACNQAPTIFSLVAQQPNSAFYGTMSLRSYYGFDQTTLDGDEAGGIIEPQVTLQTYNNPMISQN